VQFDELIIDDSIRTPSMLSVLPSLGYELVEVGERLAVMEISQEGWTP
jgi:hypothetical protein